MSLLLISVVIFLGAILGKHLFRYWFNHLTIFCLIFGGSIFLYELKLLPYIDLTEISWLVIILSFTSFLMGILTVISARKLKGNTSNYPEQSIFSMKLFSDEGKTLKYAVLILGLITLYSAIELWMILINQFGSIPGVLLNAKAIYRLNIEGKITGNTPYIFLFGFVGVFLSGIYIAYKGKFKIIALIPLISIILRDLATSGRVAMLFGLFEFAFSFFLFRHILKNDPLKRFRFSKTNAIIGLIVIISLFTLASSLVRLSRGDIGSESISGANRGLLQTRTNLFISPSVYLYASSCPGVLTKYLSLEGENTKFGQHTFQSVYLFLAKLGVIPKPFEYQKGYYFPMWSNNGTFVRELHADFGTTGILLVPYLLGLIITWLWFRFHEKKELIVFAFLVYLNIIIGFSFLLMVTRFIYWTVGLTLTLISVPILEKIAQMISIEKRSFIEPD